MGRDRREVGSQERSDDDARLIEVRRARIRSALGLGLRYIDSWVADTERVDRCFQLMQTDNPGLFDTWRAQWADVADFEIYPVIKSEEAAARAGVRWSSRTDG